MSLTNSQFTHDIFSPKFYALEYPVRNSYLFSNSNRIILLCHQLKRQVFLQPEFLTHPSRIGGHTRPHQ